MWGRVFVFLLSNKIGISYPKFLFNQRTLYLAFLILREKTNLLQMHYYHKPVIFKRNFPMLEKCSIFVMNKK